MNNLKRARLLAGLTQKEVAERLGVTVTTISAWETDITEPKALNFMKACWLYGADPNDIFVRSEFEKDGIKDGDR